MEEQEIQIDEGMKKFARYIKKRLNRDWDCVIGVTGRSGKGKSTLVIGWLGPLIDELFSIEKNVCLIPKPEQIQSQFKTVKKVLVIDEAVRAMDKHKWADRMQQAVVQMYDTERWQNKCTFFLMPRWSKFTEHFRNFRIDIWIDVIERGRAIVYVVDADKDIVDPWHIQENFKSKKGLFKKRVVERSVESRVKFEQRLPNYAFDFKFPDWPSTDMKQRYESAKANSRDEGEVEEDKRSLAFKWRNYFFKLYFAILNDEVDVFNQSDLSRYLGDTGTNISAKFKDFCVENGLPTFQELKRKRLAVLKKEKVKLDKLEKDANVGMVDIE